MVIMLGLQFACSNPDGGPQGFAPIVARFGRCVRKNTPDDLWFTVLLAIKMSLIEEFS